jgi:hypothetical protein
LLRMDHWQHLHIRRERQQKLRSPLIEISFLRLINQEFCKADWPH